MSPGAILRHLPIDLNPRVEVTAEEIAHMWLRVRAGNRMFSTLRTPAEDTIDFLRWPVQIAVPTKDASLKEDRMAMAPDMDTARIERTMRVIEYEGDKPKIKRFLEARLEDPEAEPDVPTDWDLSFDEYLEEHKNSKLLFCWYSRSVGIVFSPSDHNGIWAGRLEGVKGKGTLPAYVLKVVERIAKEKGLA